MAINSQSVDYIKNKVSEDPVAIIIFLVVVIYFIFSQFYDFIFGLGGGRET